MPIALIGVAAFMILTAIKGNYAEVGSQFQSDVVGPSGFISFLIGLVGISVFFRLIGLPGAGRFFLALVIVVFLLQNPGVITALETVSAAATPSTSGAT